RYADGAACPGRPVRWKRAHPPGHGGEPASERRDPGRRCATRGKCRRLRGRRRSAHRSGRSFCALPPEVALLVSLTGEGGEAGQLALLTPVLADLPRDAQG